MKFLSRLLIYGIALGIGALTIDQDEDFETEFDEVAADNSSTINGTIQFVKKLSNITRDSGQNITLHCDVKNYDLHNVSLSKIRIRWQLNDAPVRDNKRFIIKRSENAEIQLVISRLKIVNLEIHDTGFYTCIASNGKLKIRSTAFLKVSRELWSSTSIDLPTYDPMFPETPSLDPDFTTLHPSSDRKERDDIFPTSDNKPSPSIFMKNFNDPSQPNVFHNYSINEPFCQLYRGNTCKQFLQDKFVFVQPPFTQKNIEEKLENAFLVISHSNDLSTNCEGFALPSLCYSAFPICVDEQQINMHHQHLFSAKISNAPIEKVAAMYRNVRNDLPLRRICKEDCELLENELCRQEYAIAKTHPVIGQTLQLEECVNLPDQTARNLEYCLPLGIDRAQYVQADDDCFWGKGETYRGIQEKSKNNTRCLKWAHQFQIQLSSYPELAGGHGYCRNPGGMESEPFCFVEQNKRELCNVPKCATYMWIYISVAFVLFTVVGIGAVLYFCCIQNRKQNPRSLQNMNIPAADKNIYGNSRMNSPMELNPMLPQQSNIPPMRNQNTNKNNFQNVPNYTYKEVSFIEELGEGAFGKVYKGELKMKSGKIFVAVKALKENASAKTQADFQREIDLISELRHPNIICLLGIIVKQEPMCMLFEFMSEGDLHEFLRANSPSENKSLTQNEFLHIALQIALGMEYLSSNHYVHRDLAARNCLVSKELIVKISDFGLSRDMYSCDYYRVQSKSLLPVRWMPPESILYGKFTTESDVWSYGVVLWEIYSYGLQPYYGYNNQEVINMIRSRKLLPCPEYCPSYCYSLMVECWAELAIRRPSFPEICHRLRVWKQNGVQMTGAYFKNPEKNPQKFGHSSKAHFDEQEPSLTWDRKASSHNLNESQSSLTSRTSSLGNKTQSTSVSTDQPSSRNSKKAYEKKGHRTSSRREISAERMAEDVKAKNTVVNANGDNFETMLSY